jgi:hypothetical protein
VIIKGYFHKDKSPFVDVLLEIPNLNLRRKIPFLVDTGSPATILSERDVRKLHLNYDKLEPANGNVIGLGGFAKTYILKNVKLHFFTKTESASILLDELFVYRNIDKDRDIINQIPSIMGRDVLKEFTLIYNEKKNNISLKKQKKRK